MLLVISFFFRQGHQPTASETAEEGKWQLWSSLLLPPAHKYRNKSQAGTAKGSPPKIVRILGIKTRTHGLRVQLLNNLAIRHEILEKQIHI